MATLNIFRGLPGSGKSTLANKTGTLVLSPSDMYSMVDNEYNWDLEKARRGKLWTLEIFEFTLLHEIDITIATVLPTIESVMIYVDLALAKDYNINVVDCKIDVEESYKRNVHKVPIEHIKNMNDLWEDWDDKYLEENYV